MTSISIHILLFGLGLTIGSILGRIAVHYSRGKNLFDSVTYCEHCGQQLTPVEYFPLFGYWVGRGRRRCCQQLISFRQPFLEIGLGSLYVMLYRWFGLSPNLFPVLLFATFLIAGMWVDMERRLIPNKITLSGISLGLLSALLFSRPELWDSLLGIVVCGGFLYLGGMIGEWLFKKRHAMGGGDIKYAAMIGAFLGWEKGLWAVYLATVAAVLFGLTMMLIHRKRQKGHEICFGPFLAGGALTLLLFGKIYMFFY